MLFECLLWQVHEHWGLQNHQKGIPWTSEQILGSKMPLQNGKMSLCWCLLKMLLVCFNLNMISSSKNHFIFTPFKRVILICSCWAKLSPSVLCFVLQLWDWIEGNWIVIWYIEQGPGIWCVGIAGSHNHVLLSSFTQYECEEQKLGQHTLYAFEF